MDVEEIIKPKSVPTNEEIRTDLPENPVSSPDFKPVQKPTEPEEKGSDTKQNNDNGNEKNGQKRMKTESEDCTSKKPRITPDCVIVKKNSEIENMSDNEEFYLTVSNMPSDWTYVQIKNYLDKECGHVDEMEMLKKVNSQGRAIRLTFQSSQMCKDILKKLENKVVQDKKLILEMTESIAVYPPPVTVATKESNQNKMALNAIEPSRQQDTSETADQNLYGLRPQFLTSLNITPPLTRLVHVTNFRCDKHELREVMELAGNVLMCCVVASMQRYAKVMYNHPLEAVQAISMLNGQMYYGVPLKITMDKNSDATIVLPKGLAGIGLGLGLLGKPIRNIEQQYEKYAKNEDSLINPIIFSKINTSNSIKMEDDHETETKINEFMKSVPNCNLINHKKPYKIKNIEQLGDPDAKDGSDRSTPEINMTKVSPGGSRKASTGSGSPNQDSLTNSITKDINNPSKPLPNAPAPMGTMAQHGIIRPGLLNPAVPLHNPIPAPTPSHPNFGPPGVPPTFHGQQRPFGPRPVPFMPQPQPMPQPMPQPIPQRAAFRPAAMPTAFGPQGMRPQIPPATFSVPRPFGGPNLAVPRTNLNPGNRLTVNFSNLPPSTTFPLLCEQLAQCGQVMSVQLTTPGCAVATFGHPSHAERCYQTYNRMNIEGYVIEVKFA